jgi:copper chaperone CopZ
MTIATYNVDGMTCDHCVHHVTSEITALPGVRSVQIQLVVGGSSPVTVTSDEPLALAAVSAAVVEAGYALTPNRSLL